MILLHRMGFAGMRVRWFCMMHAIKIQRLIARYGLLLITLAVLVQFNNFSAIVVRIPFLVAAFWLLAGVFAWAPRGRTRVLSYGGPPRAPGP